MTGGGILWGGEYCGGGAVYFGGGWKFTDTVGGGCCVGICVVMTYNWRYTYIFSATPRGS